MFHQASDARASATNGSAESGHVAERASLKTCGVDAAGSTNLGNSAGNVTRFSGDKGMLRLDWSNAVYSAHGGIKRDGSIRGENKVELIEQTDHWVNWYRCMRDGKMPNAPLDAGYQHAVASIMATMSYETGRRARFDQAKRTITLD